ncbi:hypothetical protein OSTOST_16787, partial [Ostertagia ostertagi]
MLVLTIVPSTSTSPMDDMLWITVCATISVSVFGVVIYQHKVRAIQRVFFSGKLKGKAPILQWIGRVEMKQYQDCPVAVRVPRQFDEPEEDQLFREISSMRRLRHHDHIALFLGT